MHRVDSAIGSAGPGRESMSPREVLLDRVSDAARPAMLRRPGFRRAAGLAILTAALACEEASTPHQAAGAEPRVSLLHPERVRLELARPASDTFFFPPGALIPVSDDLDTFVSNWFSRSLARMNEPSLSAADARNETYRLLVLPTWGMPRAVRVDLGVAAPSVSAVELSGDGGYDPGQVRRRAARALTSAERQQLVHALSAASFWSLASFDPERVGHDGTVFIVEGRADGRYHVVHRWMPEAGTYRELCSLLRRLGGL